MLNIAEREDFNYADVDKLGQYTEDNTYNQKHIEAVKALKLADLTAIRERKFRVCVDTINSVGGVILPKLLDELGVEYKILYGEPTGDFAHNPEPIEKNLSGIMEEMRKGGYDLGIVVDPDVDRLAFIQEDGVMFGEEYTLVSVADYILDHVKRQYREQSFVNPCAAGRDGEAWRQILCIGGGRSQCDDEDEGGQCRHRRRGKRWRYLSGESLRA